MAKIAQSSTDIEVQDIAAIVNATGFSASPAVGFLPANVKQQLGFDASCPRLPLLLNTEASSSSDAAPSNLALIGFSYGSYWGILETQARMIAHKWSLEGHHKPQQDESPEKEKSQKIYTFMTELRTMMKKDPSAVAQNFFGDYPGLMEECFRHLNLKRVDLQYGPRNGMVSPARYVDNGCDIAEAEKTMSKVQEIQNASAKHSAFAARAAFTALHGIWNVKSIGYLDPIFDSVPLTATFHPRRTTAVGFDAEYLFMLQRSSASKDEIERRVYRLREIDNEIEVWSADHLTAEKMLLKLEFGKATADEYKKSLAVTNSTMDATTTYNFVFSAVQIPSFRISISSNTESVIVELAFSR
jgi:hypothetical protein